MKSFSLDQLRERSRSTAALKLGKIGTFSKLMPEKLDNGDIQSRNAYIRTVISTIEVDDHALRIIAYEPILAAAIAGKQTFAENIRGFVRKWRATNQKDSNVYVIEIYI